MKNTKSIVGYSRAIFEIAVEEEKQDQFFSQLKKVQQSVTSDLLAFVANPAFSDDERRSVFVELAERLDLDTALKAFIILVAEQGRLDRFDEIVSVYRNFHFEALNKEFMEISSAKPISAADQKRLVKEFSEKRGKELEVETSVDESLIGGVVVKVGSQFYDGSLRGRLAQLRESLSA